MPEDVNNSGGQYAVTPLDALLVVNELDTHTYSDANSGMLPANMPHDAPRLDVTGDGMVTPLDMLHVVDYLDGLASAAAATAAPAVPLAIASDPEPVVVAASTVLPQANLQSRAETRVNMETSAAQGYPEVSVHNNGFVVVWASVNQDSSSWGIIAQRFDATGERIGQESVVNSKRRFSQFMPTVAAFPNGSFVVAWQDEVKDGSGWGIFSQIFDSEGNPVGTEFQVNETTTGTQMHVKVAALDDGSIAYAWEGLGRGDAAHRDGYGVYTRLFDGTGAPLSKETRVNERDTGHQELPGIASRPGGGYVVTWNGYGSSDVDGIYLRPFGSEGQPTGGEILVNQEFKRGPQWQSDVDVAEDGRVVVAWTSAGHDASGWGVFAQQFNADLTPLGGERWVMSESHGTQWRPSVAYLGDGGFVVGWDGRGQNDEVGVHMRHFDAESVPLDRERLLSTTTRGFQELVSIDAALTGFVAVWHGYGPGDPYGVYSRIVEVTPANQPPVGEIADVTIDEQTSWTFTPNITDPDGDTITFAIDTASQAAGLTINSTTGEIVWTPSEAQGPGVFDVTLTATDMSQQRSDFPFTVTVREVNLAPTLTPPPTLQDGVESIDANEIFSAQFSATDPDLPANQLAFSLSGDTHGATINSTTGEFTWNPNGESGSFAFTVVVTDNGSPPLADSFGLSLDTNGAPTIAVIGDVTIDEQTEWRFDVNASDPDGDTLTYALDATTRPAGMTINATTGEIVWTPTEAQGPGSYSTVVTVTDSTQRSASQTFSVIVREVNRPPSLIIPAELQDGVASLDGTSFSAQFSASDPDLPTNQLTYVIVGDAHGAAIDSNSGEFLWSPNGQTGETQFEVSVRDNGTPVLDDSFTFTININQSPTVTAISDQTIPEEQAVTIQVSATDAEGDVLTYALDSNSLAAGLAIDPGTGEISWTPTEADGPGTFPIEVTVSDGKGGSTAESFTISVSEVNKAPSLMVPPELNLSSVSVDAGTAFSTTFGSSDPDFPLNSRTYRLVGDDHGATLDTSTGAFSWSPSSTEPSAVFTIAVFDDGEPSLESEQFTFTVGTSCPFSDNLSGWSVSEFGGTETPGTVFAESCFATMVEGDSFAVELSQDFVVNEPTVVRFVYDNLAFDASSTNEFINDAFEVAIVDSSGRSLVTPYLEGRDAFFNITEELLPATGPGVIVEGQEVSVVLSGVPAGTDARVIFRLVNDDDDEQSTVTITEFGISNRSLPVLSPSSFENPGVVGTSSSEIVLFQVGSSSSTSILPALTGRGFSTEAVSSDAVVIGSNLVQNGGFEDGLSNIFSDYDHTPTGNDHEGGYWITPYDPGGAWGPPRSETNTGRLNANGDNSLSAGVRRVWFQSVPVEAGKYYQFSAWAWATHAQEDGYQLKFSIDGLQIGDVMLATEVQVWESFNATYVADRTGVVEISIVNVSGRTFPNDFMLDDISLYEVVAGTTELPLIAVSATSPAVAVGETVLLTGRALGGRRRLEGSTSEFSDARKRISFVSMNGRPVDVLDAAGHFFASVEIQPGQNVFEFEAFDEDGVSARTAIEITGETLDLAIDFANYADISDSFQGVYGRTSFVAARNLLYVDLATRNNGRFETNVPLLVGVKGISDASVQTLGIDGVTPDGIPFYDFTEYVSGGTLAPEEETASPTIAFLVPEKKRFDYELVFYGKLNEAPVITSLPKIEALVGHPYLYDVDASDADDNALVYRLTSHPDGMEIDSDAGIISWAPLATDVGNHEVTVVADDQRGGKASQTFALSVHLPPPNRPPVITSVPIGIASIGGDSNAELKQIDLSTWSQVQYNLFEQGNANWVIEAGSTVVRQVLNADASIYLSDFDVANSRIEGTWVVEDGSDDDYMGFVFGYQDNEHYYLLDWKAVGQGDGVLGFADAGLSVKVISADSTLTGFDLWPTVDNDRVGLLFHDATVGWKPNTEYRFALDYRPGSIAISVYEGDVLVREPITVNDDTYVSGQFGFYNYSQGGVVYRGFTRQELDDPNYIYDVDAFDIDDDALSYSTLQSPGGMRIDAATGVVSWSPTYDQIGEHTVEVEVDDGHGGIAIQRYTVAVKAFDPDTHQPVLPPTEAAEFNVECQAPSVSDDGNAPPTFSSAKPIGNIIPGDPFAFTLTAADSDGDTLCYQMLLGPSSVRLHPTTGELTWTSTNDDVGPHNVIVQVSDQRGGTDIQDFELNVVDRNTAPYFTTTPTPIVPVGVRHSYKVRVQERDVHLTEGSEPAGVVWTVPSQMPSGVSWDENNTTLSWLPGVPGSISVPITVTDGGGASATQVVNITAEDGRSNTPPVFRSVPNPVAQLGAAYSHQFNIENLEGDALAFSLSGGPVGMTIDELGRIRWTPETLGSYSVTVSMTDRVNATVRMTFPVEVVSERPNTAPQIISNPITHALLVIDSAAEKPVYSYDLRATDSDGDVLTWSLAVAPVGMSIHPDLGTIRWIPTFEQLGLNEVTVRVSDSRGATALQRYVVDVNCVNLPPNILSIPPTQAFVGQTYYYPVRTVDPEGDGLVFTTSGGSVPIDSQSGLIAWTPDTAGPQSVTIQVSDGANIVEQSYNILVLDPLPGSLNRPPEITSSPVFSAEVGTEYQYTVEAIDPDGDELTYSFAVDGSSNPIRPADMAFDGNTIRWTPGAVAENVRVAILVTDTSGAVASQGFSITVAQNLPPTTESTPKLTVTAGARYRYTVQASDDRDPATALFYRLDAAPDGMEVDRFGRIIWDVPDDYVGSETQRDTETIRLVVSDTQGAEAVPQEWIVSVKQDDEAPVVELQTSANARLLHDGDAVNVGKDIVVTVFAVDDVGVASRSLTVNGTPVPLDGRNSVVLSYSEPQTITLAASAVDRAGNVSETVTRSLHIQVISTPGTGAPNLDPPSDPGPHDPADQLPPIAEITAPEYGKTVTSSTEIVGTVSDPENRLWFYNLYRARLSDVDISFVDLTNPAYVRIAQGTEPVENGVLGSFDPSMLSNDAYVLVILAYDKNGLGTISPPHVVNVSGNLKVGNFRLELTDLSLPLAGIPITVTRVYDTLEADREGDFGYGWSLGVQDAHIFETIPADMEFVPGDTKVYLTTPDGRRVGFTYDEELLPIYCDLECYYAGVLGDRLVRPFFKPDPGVYETLEVDRAPFFRGGITDIFGAISLGLGDESVRVNFDRYILTTKDGLKYQYHETDGLESISDQNGNKVTFTENGATHSTGQSVTFVRDWRGRIKEVVAPDNTKIQYEYNLAGDLAKVVNQASLPTRYEYRTEPAHYLDKAFDYQDRQVITVVYEQNPDTRDYEFKRVIDANGNPIDDRDFDIDQMTGVIRDGNGNETFLKFDERGNILEERDANNYTTYREYEDPLNPDLETRITDRMGNVTERTYDARGNVLTITEMGSVTNPVNPPQVTSFTYDAGNRVTSITNAKKSVTRFEYDSKGNLVRITNAENNSSSFSYYADGRRESFTDFNGNVTRFTYSGTADQPSRVTFDDDTYQAFAYNVYGQVTLEQYYEADGTLVEQKQTKYDELGRVIEEIMGADGDPKQPATIVQKFYNGNLLAYEVVVNPQSPKDANGRVTETEAQLRSAALSPVTSYLYDQSDRIIKQTDAEGGIVEFRYDAQGNRVALMDPVGNVTTWIYDELNRMTEERDPLYWANIRTHDAALAALSDEDYLNMIAPVDPVSPYNATDTRDPLYDNPSQADCDTNKAIEHIRLTCYDAEGNQSKTIDRNARRREFEYDYAGRLLEERWYNAPNDPKQPNALVETITFTYDALGNMLTATDSNSNYLYTYDTLNRLHSVDNNPDGTRDVPRVILTYGYDAQGNVTLTQDDSGVTVASTYNERNLLETLKWYDADGSGDVDDARVDFQYNAAGREAGIQRYSDLTATTAVGSTVHTYDLAGRSDILKHCNALACSADLGDVTTLIAAYDYDYDFSGLLEHEERFHQTAEYAQSIDYRYDLTGQLTDAMFSGQDDEHYEYDANGNRVFSRVGEDQRSYTTDAANRLKGDGKYEYRYDGEGNLTKRIDLSTGETRTFNYDHRNRLELVEDWTSDPGDPRDPDLGALRMETVAIDYDVHGRRVLRIAVADDKLEREYFVYQNENVWADYREPGKAVARYLFGVGIDSTTAHFDDTGGTKWYLTDQFLSIRDEKTVNGSIVLHQELGAFGNSSSGEAFLNRYTFVGREPDSAIKVYYFRARFYDSDIGRFISEDPIRHEDAANLFAYVHNSPTLYKDPTGESLVPYVITAVAVYSVFELAQEIDCRYNDKPFVCSPNLPGLGDLDPAGFALSDFFSRLAEFIYGINAQLEEGFGS